jgi:2',3'-cyclic-nucleotide 2'-phosphodiesterase (5'-nucleotidase family)
MKRQTGWILVYLFVIYSGFSCNTSYQSTQVQYKTYSIAPAIQKDPKLQALINPYSDSVNKSMNQVIGEVEKTLEKKSPGGSLGNFMADVFYVMAKEKFNMPIDIAFMNYGGIRLNQLAAGTITRGKIYELMPFDNLLNVQKVRGDVLQQFLDHIASRGGWPVAGMTMQIRDKKAVNILIGGKPIDHNAVYSIVNSDYVAGGGDDSEMLRNIPQETIGYLMRDALFDYIAKLTSQGKKITATEENRITNAQ